MSSAIVVMQCWKDFVARNKRVFDRVFDKKSDASGRDDTVTVVPVDRLAEINIKLDALLESNAHILCEINANRVQREDALVVTDDEWNSI